ncbi:protein pleiotropic regulatory locus 1 [Selaginella moellendorffii]|nr:protein pleiotropic regulatory locus 1 [Selaginella moellendorffii]XP_024528373.1 protein pleiotropic regulatory locus 1 [Selaginella moellendorffii]|eukprot:XP_024528372.1 protein pleiotropic regulatory locus 1 [Selaginella moellendorffii]
MPAAMEATQAMDVDEAPLVPSEKPQSIEQLTLSSLQQAAEFFGNAPPDPVGAESRRIRTAYKHAEYAVVKDLPQITQQPLKNAYALTNAAVTAATDVKPAALPDASPGQIVRAGPVGPQPAFTPSGTPESGIARYQPSAAVMRRLPSRWPKPEWHAPWKNYRVISAHLGWVRAIAFDPGNEWFCTGSADRTIKIWDTASATLKLTLTGHVEQVRGLAVSPRHPYMFSAGDDKQVKCWDLEYNKVIRSYHGHLSGVYCLTLHPTLDILLTGGRDSVCRVWDMRTKAQIFALSGHDNTVCSVITQATDPQVVTGSHDCTVKLWNLAAGKTLSTLTFHKKSVRALALHPLQPAFASASADNIKKFSLPRGEFVHNMLSQQKAIVNCMALNEENVLVTGGDNGSIWFWDWTSGHNFQQTQTIVQPGSLDAEASIFAASFDITGTRLVTCEADKTIKMWRQDENATPQTHPLNFRPPRDIRRF